MDTKDYLLLSLTSLLLFLISTKLGGNPFGHDYKFFFVEIAYSAVAFIYFRKSTSSKQVWRIASILILPVLPLLYILIANTASVLAYLSISAYFLAIMTGWLLSRNILKLQVVVAVIFLSLCSWVLWQGFEYWLK